MIDIAIIQDANGQYDIGIDPDTGDLQLVDGFETALQMSMFCERRADESEVETPELRRGWWGNEVDPTGFEIGSKLWLLYQSQKTQATLNAAVDHAKNALQWLIDDEHLESLDVSASFTANGIRLDVTLRRSNSAIETRSFDLWEGTDAV